MGFNNITDATNNMAKTAHVTISPSLNGSRWLKKVRSLAPVARGCDTAMSKGHAFSQERHGNASVRPSLDKYSPKAFPDRRLEIEEQGAVLRPFGRHTVPGDSLLRKHNHLRDFVSLLLKTSFHNLLPDA
jgi:hypothetical protein